MIWKKNKNDFWPIFDVTFYKNCNGLSFYWFLSYVFLKNDNGYFKNCRHCNIQISKWLTIWSRCPLPPFLQGGGYCLQKGGACIFWSFRRGVGWVKTGLDFRGKLISFKLTNKDSIIRKTSWNLAIHYVNTTFDFFGNSLLEKGKYLVIETSYFCVQWSVLCFV